jgi:hypothetical protein
MGVKLSSAVNTNIDGLADALSLPPLTDPKIKLSEMVTALNVSECPFIPVNPVTKLGPVVAMS